MTATPVLEGVAQALANELALVWGEKLGAAATVKAGTASTDAGWLVSVPLEGAAHGQAVVWLENAAVVAAAKAALTATADPAADKVSGWLRELIAHVAEVWSHKAGNGVMTGAATVTQGPAPATAAPFDIAVTGGSVCKVAVHAEVTAATGGSRRLEAVLDVDLPLVVRFGRATMTLRMLAALGPGSMIDMGRSPDEPVELLVGDRLIARGEVVIVGGNYGVRITDLTGSSRTTNDLEVRAS